MGRLPFDKQDRCSTLQEFVSSSVYPGIACPPEATSALHNSVEDILWLMQELATRYLKGAEYNAYKHGLRILPASATLAVDATGGLNNFRPILSMPHSLTFLEFTNEVTGRGVQQVTKQIDAESAYQALFVMAKIAETIKTIRIAGLKRTPIDVTFYSLDRPGLRLHVGSSYSISL